MAEIKLLDCTLRDGGYINNWNFGKDNIKYIVQSIAEANVEIIELGFLRDEIGSKDRAVWNQMEKASEYVMKNMSCSYAVMLESFNLFPLNKIPDSRDTDIDIIRVICWRKLQNECIDYCRRLINKGYKVCIQPDRVNQYSIEEFKKMCEAYMQIDPYAIYVVDSNGFLSQKEILKYLYAAEEVLPEQINIGYHGHNSLLQAEGSAELFVESIKNRNIMIDGSVYGIGRASGNLNIEIFAKYLNENFNKKYNISKFVEIYQYCIKDIYEKCGWGYSMESYLSSTYRCNPNYASILNKNYNLTMCEIEKIIMMLSEEDKVITNRDIIPKLVKSVLGER